MATTESSISEYLQQAVYKFDLESEKLLKAFENSVENRPIPEHIFHYTDDQGLSGILESGTFRLTDIFRQNDPSELQHGLAVASNAIKSKITDDNRELSDFSPRFERYCKNGGLEDSAHVFISCFCADSDNLGQWRTYANNGHGFALGFRTDMLEKAFLDSNSQPKSSSFSTFPIEYDDYKLLKIQKSLVDHFQLALNLSRELDQKSDRWKHYMASISSKFSVSALRAAILFKHKAYENENEYRFFQLFAADQPLEGLKYTRKPSLLKGYLEFDWRKRCPKALKKIVVGPAADKTKAKNFVNDCLRAYNTTENKIDVEYSDIPYRG